MSSAASQGGLYSNAEGGFSINTPSHNTYGKQDLSGHVCLHLPAIESAGVIQFETVVSSYSFSENFIPKYMCDLHVSLLSKHHLYYIY